MTDKAKPLDNNRTGIFGKGGPGKSTVAVLLAKAPVEILPLGA